MLFRISCCRSGGREYQPVISVEVESRDLHSYIEKHFLISNLGFLKWEASPMLFKRNFIGDIENK